MTFQERYRYNPNADLLGKGGFSRVFKAHDTVLGRNVALKVFHGSTSERYDLVSEIKKVIALEHPNLCRYYDVAFLEGVTPLGETESYQVGIMEYLDGGDIRSFLKSHPEHIRKLLEDVLQGLTYLHENGIIHRDLKPQNILIKTSNKGPVAKITDFGISKAMDTEHSASSALMGTIEYMAPEQFNPIQYGIDGKISTNLDLWSFALLTYELLTGRHLFGTRSDGHSSEQLMSKILGEVDPRVLDVVPLPYRDLIRTGLVKDAKNRIKRAEDLIQILSRADMIPPAPPPLAETQQEQSADVPETAILNPARVLSETPPHMEESEQISEKPEARPEVQLPHSQAVVVESETPATQLLESNLKESGLTNKQAEGSLPPPPASHEPNLEQSTQPPLSETQEKSQWWKFGLVGAFVVAAICVFVFWPKVDQLQQAQDYYFNGQHDEAISLYQALASKGDAHASAMLAVYWWTGLGPASSNDSLALEYAVVSANKGSAIGAYLAGLLCKKSGTCLEDGEFYEEMALERMPELQKTPIGQGLLGGWYSVGGMGLMRDTSEMVRWSRKAAESGDPLSMYNMAKLYYDGYLPDSAGQNCLMWCKKAYQGGHLRPRFYLLFGEFYLKGVGVEKNPKLGFHFNYLAAEEGDEKGITNVGYLYLEGKGVEQNAEEGAIWLRKAAEQGFGEAQAALGELYRMGEGVVQDLAEAYKWTLKSVDQEYAAGQAQLGMMYYTGMGVGQDDEEAFFWFEKSAKQGLAHGQTWLGECYYKGIGVESDRKTAAEWYLKAANQGEAYAQVKLANMYLAGDGVKQSDAEAFKWFEKAALRGDVFGQSNLGFMYEQGKGTTKNVTKAIEWYEKAYEQGDKFSTDALERLGVIQTVRANKL